MSIDTLSVYNMEFTQIPLQNEHKKVAQNAGNNSLTFTEMRGENIFDGVLCKETIIELTFARKIAGFDAKNQPFKGV